MSQAIRNVMKPFDLSDMSISALRIYEDIKSANTQRKLKEQKDNQLDFNRLPEVLVIDLFTSNPAALPVS